MVKNLPANGGDIKDVGLIPELGRSPGEGNGNPLQYSYLENCMDRRAWWATAHRVALPGGSDGDESAPWFGKIPWKRKWQPTAAFLPGKSHEQRSLAGYGP